MTTNSNEKLTTNEKCQIIETRTRLIGKVTILIFLCGLAIQDCLQDNKIHQLQEEMRALREKLESTNVSSPIHP